MCQWSNFCPYEVSIKLCQKETETFYIYKLPLPQWQSSAFCTMCINDTISCIPDVTTIGTTAGDDITTQGLGAKTTVTSTAQTIITGGEIPQSTTTINSPEIQTVSPTYGPVAGGTNITITGRYFPNQNLSCSLEDENGGNLLELTFLNR